MGKIKSNFRKKDNESEASLIEKERYKILPKEEDEDTNPKIKLYNEMVRRIFRQRSSENKDIFDGMEDGNV